MTMNYFERLQAIEKLIAELKAEQQITEFLQRDGEFIKQIADEQIGEDTPDIDVDATPFDGYAEKDANDYEA